MSLLVITDLDKNKKLLDSQLMELGYIDFHSISIEDNISLWKRKMSINLLVLFLPNSNREVIEKIISSCDAKTRIVLASEERFPKYSNVLNLKNEDYLVEFIVYIKNYIQLNRPRKDVILIRINDKFKKIKFSDIEYLQADGKNVTLNLGNRSYSIRSSLKAMLLILPDLFIRVHASYIVNADKIESILIPEQNIELTNGSVPFSRKYKSSIMDRFHLG